MKYLESLVIETQDAKLMVDYELIDLADGDCHLEIYGVFKYSKAEQDYFECGYDSDGLAYLESKILDYEASKKESS